MATGRRRGRAFIYVAFLLILILLLVFAVVRFGLLPGATPASSPDGGGGGQPAPTLEPTPLPMLVFANTDIRRGEVVRNDQLSTRSIDELGVDPATFVEGENPYYTRVEQVANGNSRALYDINAGQVIERNQVYTPGVSSRLPSFEIPTGKVAISIPTSRLMSVAFGLQRGDHVNVLVSLLMVDLDTNWQSAMPNRSGYILAAGPRKEETQSYLTTRNFMAPEYSSASGEALSFFGRVELEPTTNSAVWTIPGEAQRPRLVSQTLLQDVVVLQLGNFDLSAQPQPAAPSVQPTDAAGAAPQQEIDPATGQVIAPPAPATPDIITLIVDPQDAVTLNYLLLAGARLNLVMRSVGDSQRIDTEAVTLQFILDQYRIPNPAKLPYGTNPRVDGFPANVDAFPDPVIPTPTPPAR